MILNSRITPPSSLWKLKMRVSFQVAFERENIKDGMRARAEISVQFELCGRTWNVRKKLAC